jgi:hypothetical protein
LDITLSNTDFFSKSLWSHDCGNVVIHADQDVPIDFRGNVAIGRCSRLIVEEFGTKAGMANRSTAKAPILGMAPMSPGWLLRQHLLQIDNYSRGEVLGPSFCGVGGVEVGSE